MDPSSFITYNRRASLPGHAVYDRDELFPIRSRVKSDATIYKKKHWIDFKFTLRRKSKHGSEINNHKTVNYPTTDFCIRENDPIESKESKNILEEDKPNDLKSETDLNFKQNSDKNVEETDDACTNDSNSTITIGIDDDTKINNESTTNGKEPHDLSNHISPSSDTDFVIVDDKPRSRAETFDFESLPSIKFRNQKLDNKNASRFSLQKDIGHFYSLWHRRRKSTFDTNNKYLQEVNDSAKERRRSWLGKLNLNLANKDSSKIIPNVDKENLENEKKDANGDRKINLEPNKDKKDQSEHQKHAVYGVLSSLRKTLSPNIDEPVPDLRDPTIWSTGNFSGGPVLAPPAPPLARSAPASPLQPPQTAPQRSPHHDKSGKPPSWSGGEGGGLVPPAGNYKARQKKFHRHFPQAAQDERVLNYYSCALVGDILLQGHLYITKNYFAFYSNVFGYVTKLLIPLSSVVRVSKEKMARIIPNAVGVTTLEDKHVFASLLSRDTTYKLMTQVWKASPTAPVIELSPEHPELRLKGESELSLDEDSSWCSQSGGEEPGPTSPAPLKALPGTPSPRKGDDTTVRHRSTPRIRDPEKPVAVVTTLIRKPSIPIVLSHTGSRKRMRSTSSIPVASTAPTISPTSRFHYVLMTAASVLLVLLFFLAIMLFYRVLSTHSMDADDNVLLLKRGDDLYNQILKWHSQLHSKSALQIHEFLHSNLDQIAKVRQSLETLSTLIGGIITDKSGSREGHEFLGGRTEGTILPANPEAQS